MRFTITSQGADRPLELDIRGYHIEVSDMTGGILVSDRDGRLAVSFIGTEVGTDADSPALQTVPAKTDLPVHEVAEHVSVDDIPVIVEPEQLEVVETAVEQTVVAADTQEPAVVQSMGSAEQAELLFQHLVGLCKKIASEAKLPPYIIFHDKTLHDMCRLLPTDLDTLSTIQGVGQTKLEKYGMWFIQVIQEHVSHMKEVA